jgi:hypothetical protein
MGSIKQQPDHNDALPTITMPLSTDERNGWNGRCVNIVSMGVPWLYILLRCYSLFPAFVDLIATFQRFPSQSIDKDVLSRFNPSDSCEGFFSSYRILVHAISSQQMLKLMYATSSTQIECQCIVSYSMSP